jgi:hypothetical protein
MKHLVLIETSGNQRYIFSTNKLRENIGASELTYQIGTKIVLAAVGRDYDYENDNGGSRLRQILLNETPIEDQTEENAVEIIIATSGKALLLTKTPQRAREIVREVTRMALKEMPGLTVHGAIVEISDLVDIHDAVKRVHRKLEEIRHKIPSNQQRFQRLPFVEPCATSGLPAREVVRFKNDQGEDSFAFSQVTITKRRILAKDKSKISDKDVFDESRIINLLTSAFDVKLPRDLEELEEVFPQAKWLSVIHADGNGLGEIFLKFDEYLDVERNNDEKKTFKSREDARKYLDTYRKFSIALDICTVNAAGFAIKKLQNLLIKQKSQSVVPVVPIILGGDDLTILCDGKYALKLTYDFLTQFEKETAEISRDFEIDGVKIQLNYFTDIFDSIQGIISQIANKAFGVNRLGICAGIAIIKPHYPFHQAYDLSEQLLQSAKKSKEISSSLSAFDYHVLYDSSGIDLDEIRAKFKGFKVARPYIVSDKAAAEDFVDKNKTKDDERKVKDKRFIENHHFSQLAKRVEVMRESDKDDPNKRKIPNSQLHTLRERLHLGTAEAEAFAETIRHRYPDFKELAPLFFDGNFTHFLDAMEIAEFWEGFEDGGEGNE